MFVRKLVEKASKKIQYPAHIINSIQAEDVNPRLAFHYGVPSGSSSMAYDRIQHILAIATNDGRIKLFGWDGAQAFLQSEEAVPSKFLQFLENQGILLSVNTNNHIEVWDVAAKQLRDVYMFNGEITSFVVIEQSFFIYVGNSLGDVSVFKLDKGQQNLLRMQYRIPFTESHGSGQESSEQIAAIHVFPQPMAEARRVLIVFRDGLLSLWGIQESKALFTSGNIQQLSTFEHRKAVSACWVCNFGSKIAVGYSNGDLCLWGIPVYSKKHDPQANQKEVHIAPNIPFLKLNLGYKMDKIPITSLKWLFGDGRASRLYINGYSDPGIHSFQVIILNDNSESRTVKLALPLTEACLGMETISCFNEGNKQKQDALVLLLNSGRLCLYIDSEIENYLLKCQTKSTPSLPSHIMAKVPFLDSKVSIAKLYASAVQTSTPIEEDNLVAANKLPHFLSVDLKENVVHSVTRFEGFTKIRRLYVTGHQDGTVNFWDASSPIFLLLLSIRLHGDEGNSSNSTVTALHFDLRTQILACGDQSGLVHIISFKMEQPALGNMFNFLQVKQGPNYSISSVKLKGLVLSLGINFETRHLAVGTDKGYVFVIDMEGTTVLYQIQFPTQIYAGIISLLFENCSHNGYLKNTLLIATEDSSVIAIEEDTGNEMSSDAIQPKKPSRCLLMQILNVSPEGVCTVRNLDMVHENHDKDCISNQSLLLLCSENSVRLYSLNLAIQVMLTCFWCFVLC
ncbi:hypothetical protein AXF42_Ash014531 [Apostasia shenzhenica]|uniref:Lethal giant larvae (Lgl)-like C-terminal domain-containing protein n=1 Tax=Apostasia shenzhenica TaxID=1088818 RepID=A0A2H9ZWU8_9ASPA|nr:hypothetical protein AXF42_Ash014531 [Apostasia shenzhenica]